MFHNGLKELEKISHAVGNKIDYVQGGGGNTSVKLNNELMAIKASGFKLNQITTEEGFVVINYKNIKSYYENIDLNMDIDFEKQSVSFVTENIVELEGIKKLRPSVEVGFHSVLKKYVIHSHSVYSNILCCSENGEDIANKIFGANKYNFLWIPYINPGFNLTLKLKEEIAKCIKDYGEFPEIIFMVNHGLIVNSDDCQDSIKLHEEVNVLIKDYLKLEESYPRIELTKNDEGYYISNTEYFKNFFKENKIGDKYFDDIVLYPDQIVYLNDSISISGLSNKLNINTATGEMIYKTSFFEALTIEETLLAYFYVINTIKKKGLTIKVMSPVEVDFIKNWESERYRKNLIKCKN